jgi:light-regulated signal transduction histidine kinase (bacteriophytochrome)
VSRVEVRRETVELSKMAREVAEELRNGGPERDVEFVIADGLMAQTDPRLLRIVLTNLLGNAWKFTSKRPHARIEIGRHGENGSEAFFVRDNGAGFDMKYSEKLFGAFQRMHEAAEFPGTGIGLATVQRIIHRQGGRVWAKSELQVGTTFHFTL